MSLLLGTNERMITSARYRHTCMYSEISLYLCVALAVATKVKDIPSHPLLTIFSLVAEQPEVINLSEVDTVSSRMSEPDVFGDQHQEDPADPRHNKRSYTPS